MALYPAEGFATLSNKYLESRRIASQLYARSAMIYAFMGLAGGVPDLLSIGRPSGAVFSGAEVNYAQKMELPTQKSYVPRIQSAKVNSTSTVLPRGNMPNVVTTTTTQATVQQAGALFNMFYKHTTQLVVDHADKDFAIQGRSDDGAGLAVGDLVLNAMKIGTEDHIDTWASRMLYGSPANPFAQPISDLDGIIQASAATGFYGGVDRGLLSAGDPWLPAQPIDGTGYPVTFPKNIYQIINDANYTRGMMTYGEGANLALAGAANYLVFKQQVLNLDRSCVMINGLPNMAEAGCKREVLRVDNAYVMHEPFLDKCYGNDTSGNPLYTAQPTYVLVLNLKVWFLIFMKGHNRRFTGWQDLANQSIGSRDCDQAFLESAGILACDKPSVGISLYSGLV